MNLGIYYIGYVYKKSHENINCVSPLYLMINRIESYFEEINGDKYLNIANTNKSSEVLKKYKEI